MHPSYITDTLPTFQAILLSTFYEIEYVSIIANICHLKPIIFQIYHFIRLPNKLHIPQDLVLKIIIQNFILNF